VGDRLQRGERFGLIRFGSCTQLWLPPGSEVLVGPGDRVAGGKTVIGRLPQ
jgi:phosphatidylserine decarboxylase